MIKHLLALFLCCITLLLSAQKKYNTASMVVTMADLENNTFENDSTANAFFIYEKGYSRVENGRNYNLLTDYERKIKILNRKGFDQASIEILLYRNKSNRETIHDLVAHTYNLENNKIVRTEVSKTDIHTEKYDEHYTLIKFTFPNVKPGSIIRYSYQIESPFIVKFNGWDFQDTIPKLYSECVADLPGNYVYNIKLIGTLKLKVSESTIKKKCLEIANGSYADCSHNIYIMENIPAFKEEKYMTAKKNYFSRIDYELKEFKGFDGINKKYTETWENADRKFKEDPNIGSQLNKINLTKNILPDTISRLPNTIDKATAIYRYISKTYAWNNKFEIFRNVKIKEVIAHKTGNVSGINILLHNTLKQQGFEVNPVLLSTRKNGYVTKIYPVIYDFNYLIVQLSLDGKKYVLDATEKMLAFGQLPFRCLNRDGRVLDFKNGSSWILIEPTKKSSFYYKEEIILEENHNLNGKGAYLLSGYHASDRRKDLEHLNKEKLIEETKRQNQEVTITNISIKNEDDPEKTYKEEYEFNQNIEILDGILYIKPFNRPFFKENPFKLNQRTYPVDFGHKDSYTYNVSIKLPKNYEFIDLPKNSTYVIPNKLGSIRTNFLLRGDQLIITHRILFNSSYYPTEYYTILKEFFNLIVAIENDTLITVKKLI
ncbi:DUF3857 domain-containing protein [Aquimarina sp. AD10]|uniref:DUF3857 domain-containing protein n=1 Tax=Aquimarina sp. AD10 TaxID=1714849 RepID=UPI000E5037F5|nr:DUF3857 domain-containing protein [Aquimarina sp. AD10]AXT63513.1 DUF3857 domain-containing protein [Aquimarina sp. AD10]RKM99769.1 DUF3857 domain-containing protein [Aquimarina sp. AD10]